MNLSEDLYIDKILNEKIKTLSKEFSFDVCRITKPNLDKKTQNNLKKYISSGYHGEMNWIENSFERRKSPDCLWQESKTAIVLGVNYAPKYNPMNNLNNYHQGNISVYASGDDYHKVLKGRMKQFSSKLILLLKKYSNLKVKVFVDTAPLMEKPLAQLAGLGWQGKHTNLVSKDFGSWLFLGVILVNQKLYFDQPQYDLCGNCELCLEVCPTKAIVKPYQLDARKCISYLTIEFKGRIPIHFRKKIGNKIYGCDDCLSVCPWNKFAKVSNEFRFKDKRYNLELSILLKLNDSQFRKIFSRSPVKRIGRDRFIRNCCIAAGNSKNKKLIIYLKNLIKNEESDIIKDASSWAIKELEKKN